MPTNTQSGHAACVRGVVGCAWQDSQTEGCDMGKARIEKGTTSDQWWWDANPDDWDAPCGYAPSWDFARDILCANLKAGWR